MKKTNQPFYYHDFKKISYVVWQRILPDLLNYHSLLSDFEWVDEMDEKYMQIKTYLDHSGILPDEAKEESIKDTIKLLQEQLKEVKSLNSNSDISKARIKELENEIAKNKDELEFFNKYIKNNPCLFKGKANGQQYFSSRKKALIVQEKMVLNLVDELKFSKKMSSKKIKSIEERINRLVDIKNFDLKKLYRYIKPYIDVILTTPDSGYEFLQKNLFLDY